MYSSTVRDIDRLIEKVSAEELKKNRELREKTKILLILTEYIKILYKFKRGRNV